VSDEDQVQTMTLAGKMGRRFRAPVKVLLPAVAALGAGTAIAVAQIPGSDGKITGCYVTNTLQDPNEGLPLGTLRVIDPTATTSTDPNAYSCPNGETTITWNQQGPAGPTGPTGPQGPAGPTGAPGAGGTGNVQAGQGVDIFMVINSGTNLSGLKAERLGQTQNLTQTLSGDQNFHIVQVSSFSLGAENTVSIGSSTSGAGAGKVKFQSFEVVKPLDSLSPSLFLDLASGAHFKTVLIVVRRRSGNMSVPSFVYAMKLVYLSEIHASGSSNSQAEIVHGEAGTLTLAVLHAESRGQAHHRQWWRLESRDQRAGKFSRRIVPSRNPTPGIDTARLGAQFGRT
jgi:type VI protein secretion system component Hcp